MRCSARGMGQRLCGLGHVHELHMRLSAGNALLGIVFSPLSSRCLTKHSASLGAHLLEVDVEAFKRVALPLARRSGSLCLDGSRQQVLSACVWRWLACTCTQSLSAAAGVVLAG